MIRNNISPVPAHQRFAGSERLNMAMILFLLLIFWVGSSSGIGGGAGKCSCAFPVILLKCLREDAGLFAVVGLLELVRGLGLLALDSTDAPKTPFVAGLSPRGAGELSRTEPLAVPKEFRMSGVGCSGSGGDVRSPLTDLVDLRDFVDLVDAFRSSSSLFRRPLLSKDLCLLGMSDLRELLFVMDRLTPLLISKRSMSPATVLPFVASLSSGISWNLTTPRLEGTCSVSAMKCCMR
jgi:hypothetical protein